jgi:hypothetical protein
MSRSLQQLPGEPIILETLHEDYSLAELAAGQVESQRLMDAQPQPVIWIADLRAAPRSFTESFIAMIGKLLQTPAPQHPRLQQIVYVLPAEYRASSPLPIPMFDTLEAALQYARCR